MLGPGIGVPESPFSFSSRVDAALFFYSYIKTDAAPPQEKRSVMVSLRTDRCTL
jgi:hypothetical protein